MFSAFVGGPTSNAFGGLGWQWPRHRDVAKRLLIFIKKIYEA
jgi:hypothetical protein